MKRIIIGVVAVAVGGPAIADGTNLVVNGDAEIGSMLGWTPTDLVEIASTLAAGELGVPPGSIGQFSFYGGAGPVVQACSQSINLSDHALEIDTGFAFCTMSGVLQDRKLGGFLDTVVCVFNFQDSGGTSLETVTFVDESVVNGVWDWSPFFLGMAVPTGTRSVQVTLTMQRSGGNLTDAYADNLSFVLHVDEPPPCDADLDLDGTVDITDFLVLLAFWGPCDVICLGDLDGDNTVGIVDFLLLLSQWGPCR